MRFFNLAGLAIFAGTLLSTSAFGTTVGAGSFNLSGTAVGATDGINFYLIAPGDQKASANLPVSGVFSDLLPTSVQTIQNLTSANGVTPGTSFNFANWIQLSDGINLDATSIPIPSFPVCSATASEAVGYECLVNAASPVVLTQTVTGVAARLNVLGEAHYVGDPTLTPFTALFTSPTTNFATIAAFETYFNTNHMIPAVSYSASFNTVVTPEPAAIFMASAGLIALGLLRRRKVSR